MNDSQKCPDPESADDEDYGKIGYSFDITIASHRLKATVAAKAADCATRPPQLSAKLHGNMVGSLIAKVSPESALSAQIPPASKFEPERDIPDLTGKVIIVTGGNGGIGYQTVKQLLLKNAKVYLAARSAAKAEEAIKKLKEETNEKEAIFLKLDLADLKSVRTAAEEFLSKENRLDVLFNNAGIMVPSNDLLTVQGYDIQFGTNVLGHYFFTKLLLPALERSASENGTKARVLNTSSSGHHFAPGPTGINYDVLKGGDTRDKIIQDWGMARKWKLYGISKMGNIFISNLFARRHGDTLMSCAIHPGLIRTDLKQHMPFWQQTVFGAFLYPVPQGALTQLWAGTTPDCDELSGKYLIPWARIGKADARVDNEKTQDELFEWLEEQIKEY